MTRAFDDTVWLDTANQNGSSVIAFQSLETKTFRNLEDHKAFQSFFEKFSFSHNNDSFTEFDFCGGWIGYLSYECFAFNPNLPIELKFQKDYPLSVWKYYDTFLVQQDQSVWFCSLSENANQIYETLLLQKQNFEKQPKSNSSFQEFHCSTEKPHYLEQIQTIHEHLKNGRYFELNYSMEFSTEFLGSATDLYLGLRRISPAPMMSFFHWPEIQILSASPECFFKINQQNQLVTYPIKGTIKKYADESEDHQHKQNLFLSEKDRAELLMVTDMLRNDLGRICKIGSIHVPKVYDLQSFSHYHHLVSHIFGELKDNISFYDIFCALFPGGSITGAPKVEVMKHIQNLEARARGIYTGGVGYLSDSGTAQFAIPIRTLIKHQNHLEFATGSGIVIDSIAEKEFEECHIKAKGILETLETLSR